MHESSARSASCKAQMAMVVVLESIFEADLPPQQYAYRAGRSAQDAVRHVHALGTAGYTEVVDADLSGYFDSIRHPELLKSVARRVSDGHVLAALVKRRGWKHRWKKSTGVGG